LTVFFTARLAEQTNFRNSKFKSHFILKKFVLAFVKSLAFIELLFDCLKNVQTFMPVFLELTGHK
jgi:hypothetical protein